MKLGVLAVGVALGLYGVLRAVGVVVPWWLDVPGPVGIGMGLLAAYDRFMWRWKLGPLRFSAIPFLGGTWEGTLETTYGGAPGPHPGTLTITQTWSAIEIRFDPESERSRSHSTMAALNTGGSSQPSLEYEYSNDPRALSEPSMMPHKGVARLFLTNEGVLTGDYYTGRGRQTQGEMSFRRVLS